jgi:hypothetical protein
VGLPPFSDPWDPYHPISSLKKLHSWDEFNKCSNFGAKKKRHQGTIDVETHGRFKWAEELSLETRHGRKRLVED